MTSFLCFFIIVSFYGEFLMLLCVFQSFVWIHFCVFMLFDQCDSLSVSVVV